MAGKTVAEQLADLKATREAKQKQMGDIGQAAIDRGEGMNTAEAEQFDTLGDEIKALDADIERYTKLAAVQAKGAKPADDKGGDAVAHPAPVGAQTSIKLATQKDLPKGTRFTRYAMAMAAARGSVSDALEYAKRWDSSTPEVAGYIKAVAGTTAAPGWAAELVDEQNLAGEFVELVRAETLLGKLSGFRRVPFNVRIPVQAGGSTIGWVGEGAVKPVGELSFDTLTLGWNKVAGIVVITDELARFSSPDAEATVRTDLVAQTAQFLDDAFINPAHSAVPGVSPASITNAATPIPASGSDADAFICDVQGLVEQYLTNNLSPSGAYLVMSSVQAARLGLFRNALGQYEFPNVGANGGTVAGFPVVTSENVPTDSSGSIIALVKPSEILLADDGSVTLDASREATLDMNGGASPTFNLWQRNCIGIRAERYITWAPRRAEAVAYISGANYGPCVGS